jgi:hypothetical protein
MQPFYYKNATDHHIDALFPILIVRLFLSLFDIHKLVGHCPTAACESKCPFFALISYQFTPIKSVYTLFYFSRNEVVMTKSLHVHYNLSYFLIR